MDTNPDRFPSGTTSRMPFYIGPMTDTDNVATSDLTANAKGISFARVSESIRANIIRVDFPHNILTID